jgi:hypothetical protein
VPVVATHVPENDAVVCADDTWVVNRIPIATERNREPGLMMPSVIV